MTVSRNSMNNKIPPPIVTLFFGLCIYLSKSFFPEFSFSILSSLSIISFIVGISVLVTAIISFKNHETTINPISIEKASIKTKIPYLDIVPSGINLSGIEFELSDDRNRNKTLIYDYG